MSDAAKEAFAAARDTLGGSGPAAPAPQAPAPASPLTAPVQSPPGKDEATGNRWRARNRRRREKGLPPYTEAQQRELDAKAGFGVQAPGAAPTPGAAPARVTRDGLEAENAQLRAQLAGYQDADLAKAVGSTGAMVWDVVRRFTPREDRPLDPTETAALGKLWAPILAPHLGKVAHAFPIAAAIAGTYEILAPRVTAAITAPEPARPRVASDAAPVPPVSPDAPAPVDAPAAPARKVEGDGYTFDMEGGDK